MLAELVFLAALRAPPVEYLTRDAASRASEVIAAYAALEPQVRGSITRIVVADVPFSESLPAALAGLRAWYASGDCARLRDDCGALEDELTQGISSGALALHRKGVCEVYISGEGLARKLAHEAGHCIFPRVGRRQEILIAARVQYHCTTPLHPQPDVEEFFAEWMERRGTYESFGCGPCAKAVEELGDE